MNVRAMSGYLLMSTGYAGFYLNKLMTDYMLSVLIGKVSPQHRCLSGSSLGMLARNAKVNSACVMLVERHFNKRLTVTC